MTEKRSARSECCDAVISDCGDGEFNCVQCDNRCNPMTGELAYKPADPQPEAVSDEEWANKNAARIYGLWADDSAANRYADKSYLETGILEGIAEGRRREREDRAFDEATLYSFTDMLEAQEAAAREMWRVIFDNMPDDFTATFPALSDCIEIWKQRKEQNEKKTKPE